MINIVRATKEENNMMNSISKNIGNTSKVKKIFVMGMIILCTLFIFCSCDLDEKSTKIEVTLDDVTYSIEKENGVNLVKLPEGRPRVPRLVCEEADEIIQAYFPDGEKEATAKIIIGEEIIEYKFVKVKEKGFELQYDDRYVFKPTEFQPETFSSSNISVATVNQNGTVTIVAASEEGVIITASAGDKTEQLVISRTIKAPLDIYLLTGQSNAAYFNAEPENAPVTLKGTSYQYDEIEGGGYIRSLNNHNGSMAVGNIEASLCKILYDQTGNKTLVINAGKSGQDIKTFMPFTGESYKEIERIWGVAINQLSQGDYEIHFEPTLKSYIWIQGESDDWTDTEKYMESFKQIHNVFTSEEYFDLDYGFIVMVRSKFFRPCDAQEQLAQAYDDIIMATRVSQYFSPEDGSMRQDDLHYSQYGDNILGEETAKTIVKVYKEGLQSVPEGE